MERDASIIHGDAFLSMLKLQRPCEVYGDFTMTRKRLKIPEKIMRGRLNESGATAVEYALIASLIAAVIAASVMTLGGVVTALFQKATTLW
jgi:pilus assembly protein Flp/PilA